MAQTFFESTNHPGDIMRGIHIRIGLSRLL